MTQNRLGLPLILAMCLPMGVVLAQEQPAAPKPEAPLSFERDVRPILKAHCFYCHGGEHETKGGLDVRQKRFLLKGGDQGTAIVPGKPEESLIVERIVAGEMPPGEKKMPADQLETIRRWIAAGAVNLRDEPETLPAGPDITPEEREFWAFQPIRVVEPPLTAAEDRARTAIDAFLVKTLKSKGLTFNPDADKRSLLLRATLDLTGLPPTPEETRLFLEDTADDAYDRLLDRLLASPRYGERWGRHWLDAAGYADSDGYNDADPERPYAYKYRDYVIRSLNSDKPWDLFLTEQLAGDELVTGSLANLTPPDIERLIATGYLRMAADGTASVNNDESRNAVIADTIKIVSNSLLGLSVGCAQCHDHRYDPIPQVDYYRLRAVFEPALDYRNWRQPGQRLISLYTDADRAKAAAVEQEAGVVIAERTVKQTEFIKAAVDKELEKYEEPKRGELRAAYETPADKRTPEQQKLLAENPSVNISPGVLYQYNQAAADELKKFDAKINEIRAKKPVEDFIPALTELPGANPVTNVFHRGDYRQPTDAVTPGVLMICSAPGTRVDFAARTDNPASSGRRLAFARWITGNDNPLTARVLVNRFWLHHLGHGLVDTPGDFGVLGDRPTHPELLDWLARDFVTHGWKLKRLHKLIMQSTAYRQSTARDSHKTDIDGDDRLYSRRSVLRLDAEGLRDRILATSGVLSGRMFGPATPVKEDEVGQVVVAGDAPAPGAEVPADNPAFRRGLYIQVRRSRPLAFMNSFDAPVMEVNCDRRPSSTVAPQALMLLNSDFVLQQSGYFAARVLREAGADLGRQVERAWQLALCRPPTAEELQQSTAFLTQRVTALQAQMPPPGNVPLESLTSLCQALLGSNEFLYVD